MPPFKICDYVRFTAETPEGRKFRFDIGPIGFPMMPPAGTRGEGLIATSAKRIDGKFVTYCERVGGWSDPTIKKPNGQIQYSDGEKWTREILFAKKYDSDRAAKEAGRAAKVWNRVPPEWLPPDSKS